MPKMMMKKCNKREPPHPCDPPRPCDVCDEGDECPKPNICLERLSHPLPGWKTRCKPGKWMPVAICNKAEPPHPCDPPPPCVPGKPKSQPCPDPPLCKERVLNLEDPIVRCPDPDDQFSEKICENLDLLKQTPPSTSSKPCAGTELTDPFLLEREEEEKYEKVVDPNEYLYSRELCKNLDMLKQSIKNWVTDPCGKTPMQDPFDLDVEEYPPEEDPCDVALQLKKEKERKRYKPCCEPKEKK